VILKRGPHENHCHWPTKDGEGFSGEIPTGVLVTGRVVILKRKAGEAEV
jgi:hypothetical protein